MDQGGSPGGWAKTAFNIEWAPIPILQSVFELRSEKPTKQDFLQLSGGVLFCRGLLHEVRTFFEREYGYPF